jgi:hypothetical protein
MGRKLTESNRVFFECNTNKDKEINDKVNARIMALRLQGQKITKKTLTLSLYESWLEGTYQTPIVINIVRPERQVKKTREQIKEERRIAQEKENEAYRERRELGIELSCKYWLSQGEKIEQKLPVQDYQEWLKENKDSLPERLKNICP